MMFLIGNVLLTVIKIIFIPGHWQQYSIIFIGPTKGSRTIIVRGSDHR